MTTTNCDIIDGEVGHVKRELIYRSHAETHRFVGIKRWFLDTCASYQTLPVSTTTTTKLHLSHFTCTGAFIHQTAHSSCKSTDSTAFIISSTPPPGSPPHFAMPFPKIPTRSAEQGNSPAYRIEALKQAVKSHHVFHKDNSWSDLGGIGVMDAGWRWNFFVSAMLKRAVEIGLISTEEVVELRQKVSTTQHPVLMSYANSRRRRTPASDKLPGWFQFLWPTEEKDIGLYNELIDSIFHFDNGESEFPKSTIPSSAITAQAKKVDKALADEVAFVLELAASDGIPIQEDLQDLPSRPDDAAFLSQENAQNYSLVLKTLRGLLGSRHLLPPLQPIQSYYVQLEYLTTMLKHLWQRHVEDPKQHFNSFDETGQIKRATGPNANTSWERQAGWDEARARALPKWAIDAREFEKEIFLATDQGNGLISE